MKKIILLFSLIFASTILLQAQDAQKMLDFEDKINQFRYDLYPYLYAKPDSIYRMDDFFNDEKISQAIEKFITENKTQIIDYQKYKLKSMQKHFINFTNYEIDENLTKTIAEIDFSNEIFKFQPVLKFSLINPAEGVFLYYNMLLSRGFSVSSIAGIYTRNAIGRLLIRTQNIDSNRWKIWLDSYLYILECEYNLADFNCKPIKFYKRIP
jgi:hypothetical protein